MTFVADEAFEDMLRAKAGRPSVKEELKLSMDQVLLNLTTTPDTFPLPIIQQKVREIEGNFPNQKVTINQDKEGRLSGSITTKEKSSIADSLWQKPSETSILPSLTNRMLSATTDEEKLDLAMAVKQTAQQQAIADYNRFVKQAEARFGIPDIEAAIDEWAKRESVDPNRPAGMISDQRLALMEQLGTAKTRARQYTEDLVKGNAPVQQAIAAAETVIASFKLGDDKLRLSEMKAERIFKDQQKLEYLSNPKMMDRLAAATTGSIKPTDATRERMAIQLVNNPKSIDDRTRQFAEASQETLHNLLFMPEIKEPDKIKIKNMLLIDEIAATGDEARARKNMEIFDKVIGSRLDVDKITDITATFAPSASSQISAAMDTYRKAKDSKSTEMRTKELSQKDKNMEMLGVEIDAKKKILRILATDTFTKSISQWQGAIQADPHATAILSKVDKTKPYDASQFVADYINTTDGRSLQDKVISLRNIVTTAAVAYDKGSVLPSVNPSSLEMLIDRMAVSAISRPINDEVPYTMRWLEFR